MRKKFNSASALVYTLLFVFRFFVTSVDIPGQMMTPNVQDHQVGRDFSSSLENNTSGGIEGSHTHEETLEPEPGSSAVFRPRERNEMDDCPLELETLAQIRKSNTSEWSLNDTTITLLHNDLQQLILCTEPHDRVILRLLEPLKLNKTMNITHELELIGESNNPEEGARVESSSASITCPESGPALEVNTNRFVAKRLRFENCTASGGKAAVVIGANSKPIFNQTTFKDNMNRAVYIAKEANVTFVRTRFEGNQASGNGGAIYAENSSHIEVSSSVLTGNRASDGGAVFAECCSVLRIHDSSLLNNAARQNGGVLALRTSNSLEITRSTFLNNRARRVGGAIGAFARNSVTLYGSTFSDNSAPRGGALCAYEQNALTLNTSTISNNTAQQSGGGFDLRRRNSLILISSTFTYNIGQVYGGAIGASTRNNVTLYRSTFSDNSAQRGGALYAYEQNALTLNTSTVSSNTAQQSGGGFDLRRRNSLILISSTVKNNTAQQHGGGLFLETSNSLTLSTSTVKNNTAQQHGGGLFLETNNSLTLTSSTVTNNTAQQSGGGFYLRTRISLTLTSSTVTNNTAQQDGGGLFLETSNSLTLSTSNVTDNTAQQDGGGLRLRTSNSVVMNRSILSNNRAHDVGGGICAYTNRLTILESTVAHNSALRLGGGINLNTNNSLNLTLSNFTNNTAQQYGGAIRAYSQNKLTLIRSTFSHNSAQRGGALCACRQNAITLNESIFSDNSVQEAGGGLYLESGNLLTKFGSIVANNSAPSGGALFASESTLDIYGTVYENNTGLSSGAIHATSSKLNITNCTFCKNKAYSGQGGAISVRNGGALSLLFTTFVSNTANMAGALYTSNVNVALDNCVLNKNNASAGGACVFSDSSFIRAERAMFYENRALLESGGAIGISSNSTLHAFNVTIRGNKAATDCGGIYVFEGSVLDATRMFVISNTAENKGGGVGLFNDSSFLCFACLFKNNVATDGAAVYIRSTSNTWSIDVQLQDCQLVNNSAQYSGGGLMFDALHNNHRCLPPSYSCGHVILLNTSFMNNSALYFGSAILSTNAADVLVSCQNGGGRHLNSLTSTYVSLLPPLNPQQLCKSWKGNRLLASHEGGVVRTFGKGMKFIIDSSNDAEITGDAKFGFKLKDVQSGELLPSMQVLVLDDFGYGPAPTIPHFFLTEITSPDGFFPGIVPFNTTNGKGSFSNIAALKPPGEYNLEISHHIATLDKATLEIHIRNCLIGEEPLSRPVLCQTCGNNSYNFNPTKTDGCSPCPDEATCDGHYIVPEDGYWHKGPCHNEVKECITEEACKYETRYKDLVNFTENFIDCNITDTTLERYNDLQCNEGYNGTLCGSCAKSYGLTGNLECLRCGSVLYSVLRFLGILIYLFVGTAITIKGTLALGSRRLYRLKAKRRLLTQASSLPLEEGATIRAEEEIQEESDSNQVTTNEEPCTLSSEASQVAQDDATPQGYLVENWKILLNFVQVNSTAATMNVKWTKTILDFFKMLNLLGFAAINSVSRPIDCIVATFTIGARAILRYFFTLFVPMIVIAIFSINWLYRALARHRAYSCLYFRKRLALTVITVTYITYFDVTQMAVKAFNCIDVNSDEDWNAISTTSYWSDDTSIECYKSTHIELVGISLFVMTFVSIGFPTACSWALLRNKKGVQIITSRAHEVLGLLCGTFKEKFVFWECVTMIKKALLSIIVVFSYTLGNQTQGALLSLVLVFFLSLHTLCFPFTEEYNSLNYLESGSLLISCATYTIVQLFNDDTLSETSRSLVSISLMILNGGFVTFMLFLIARNLIELAKAVLLSKNVDISNGNRWYSILILYLKNRGWNDADS